MTTEFGPEVQVTAFMRLRKKEMVKNGCIVEIFNSYQKSGLLNQMALLEL